MSLKVTVARWFTPQGVSIPKVGLTPDVLVDLSSDEFIGSVDPILEKAVEILLENDL